MASSSITRRRRQQLPPRRWRSLRGLPALLLLFCCCLFQGATATLGGEMAYFDTEMMAQGVRHRQNVCDRYQQFRDNNSTAELKDALEGLELRVVVGAYQSAYFNYDPVTGIDPDYPGLAAILLDELARRGKFTWRDSFGIYTDPSLVNATWMDLLVWSINTYDLIIDYWAKNLARMNLGAVFLEPWQESSLILVTKRAPEEISDKVNFWNWLRPYEPSVWCVTILTILISGVVYQILEWFAGDRQERSMWEWWQENAYLSAINFTQAYEYQPTTFASRIFGISMAIWALVMTATYTANLASLLVDRKPQPILPETLEEVAVFGFKICTWEGTNGDHHIRDFYPSAIRVPKKTQLEVYQGLHNGDCDFATASVSSWHKYKAMKEYNPYCDMYWVGGDRKITNTGGGFVGSGDSGELCTSFIRDVINLHMVDMEQDGFLEDAWNREYKRTQTINCDTYRPELAEALLGDDAGADSNSTDDEGTRQRQLRSTAASCQSKNDDKHSSRRQLQPSDYRRHRELKGAGRSGAAGGAVAAASAAAGGSGGEAERLTLEQMIGTFVFHWALMVVSLALAVGNAWYVKQGKRYVRSVGKSIHSRTTILDSFSFRGANNNMAGTDDCSFEDDNNDDDEKTNTKDMDNTVKIANGHSDNSDKQQADLQSQMATMQDQMEKFQRQMLEEQQNFQLQMQSILLSQQRQQE